MLLLLLACRPETDPDPTDVAPTDDSDSPAPTGTTGTTAVTGDTGEGVPLSATVTVTDNDRMVLEKRFAVTLSRPAAVELRCTTDADPLEDHRLPRAEDAQVGFELRLFGLLADTTYDCALVGPGGGMAWEGSVTTAPLPEAFPSFVISGDPARASIDDGYLMFSHWKEGNTYPKIRRLVIADGAGRIRWYLTLLDAQTGGIAAEWDGERMVLGGGGVAPSIRNLSGDVLFEVAPAVANYYHHEALFTPEGHVLSLQLLNDGDGAVTWKGFRIEVTDPATSEVVWSLDSIPLREAGVLPRGSLTDDDPYHANAVSVVDDGVNPRRVWVSLKGLTTLMEVDWDTREVVSMIGGNRGIDLVDVAGAPLSPNAWFWGQHAPEHTQGEVLVYDNGVYRPNGVNRSRIARYRLEADQVRMLWEWSEPEWYEPNFGSVHTLADGHVFVATGHCLDCGGTGGENDGGWMLEIDPADDSVTYRLDFASFTDSTYRGVPIGGCDVFANRRFCAN